MEVRKPTCPERESLQREATKVLQDVITVTREQIECVKLQDQARLMALDKVLEATFGKKERAFGALWQHTKEHGC